MLKDYRLFDFFAARFVGAAIVCLVFSILLPLGLFGFGPSFRSETSATAPTSLLASGIFLNEVDVDTPDSVSEACEYIEIKGPAGTLAPNNLFFLSIDGDSGQFGIVNYLGDLTGLTFGTNGTITIISNSDTCAGRTYPAGTVVLEVNSVALGFGAETFLLATSTQPAQIFEGQDLDVNNDGILDAAFALTPVDGIGWVLNATFNLVYGGAPILVDSGNTDLPDAATRFEASVTPFDAASWYYGELAGANGNSTTYTAPLSANFPACGALTPGAPNALVGCITPSPTPSATPTSTSTATATNTNTPTPTPTAGADSISGTVSYGNPASPTTKFISNATVTANCSSGPPVSTVTGPPGSTAGQYVLTGMGTPPCIVSLTKTTGQNGVSSGDAARIAQHVAGVSLMTTDRQRIAADVTNNGGLASADAANIARFVAGLGITPGHTTNQWKFFVPSGTQPTFPVGASPTTRTYTEPIGTQTGQDFIGILVGEVTGNWVAGPLRPAQGPERSTAVNLPRFVTPADNEVVVPISVQGAANKGIISYEFDLRYDATVIQPQAEPVDLAGTASRGLTAVSNANEPGLLRVVLYGAMPIDGNGLLINLRFNAVGAAGSVSPLTFERIIFNEGDLGTIFTEGQVELSPAAANQAEIGGRIPVKIFRRDR